MNVLWHVYLRYCSTLLFNMHIDPFNNIQASFPYMVVLSQPRD